MRRCCCCFLAFQSLVSLLLLVASLLCVVELTEDAPALNYTEVPIQSEQPPLLWWIWNAEWLSYTDYRWTALLSLLGCDQGTVRHIQTQIFFFPSIYSCGGGSRPPTGVYSGVSSQSILCPGTNTFTTASAASISAQRIDKLLYLCWHLSLNPFNFHSVHFSTNLFTPALYETNGFAEMKSIRWITASNLLEGLK